MHKRGWIIVVLALWMGMGTGAAAVAGDDGNLMPDPGLEAGGTLDWKGVSASVELTRAGVHAGAACLHIKDQSATDAGYAQGPLMPVQLLGGGRYYAEAWVRTDPDLAMRTGYGTVVVEVQFYDANERYLSSQSVGKTTSSKWTRLSAVLTLPEDAALAAFRVAPADKIPAMVGAAFADDFYFGSLPLATSAGRVIAANPPTPPKGAPEYAVVPRPSDGVHMALAVEKLTNGFDPPRPLVIWALGSSFTEFLGNGDPLIEAIRRRFPNAPEITYKSMFGGSTPYDLLRGWARHLAVPDQPDVVLLYNFGGAEALERLIVEIRSRSTADIIVPTLHWCVNHEKVWPDPDAPNPHIDPVAIRKVCEAHGVEFVDNRREITEYMAAHGLKIQDLLVDTVHQSPYAAKIINENIARHFNRAERFSYDPRSRERRIEAEVPQDALRIMGAWKPAPDGRALVTEGVGALELRFTGRRVDLIGLRDPKGGGVTVWVDGMPADQAPVFYASYVQPAPENFIDLKSPQVDFRRAISDRCPHGIELGRDIVPQKWTITMTSDAGDYALAGSVTGADGVGNAFKPFTSASGQIIVPPELWRLAKTNRTGDRFTFDVYRCAQGQVNFRGRAEKFRTRLIENLPNGPHTVRLEAVGGGPVCVDALEVFEPPGK